MVREVEVERLDAEPLEARLELPPDPCRCEPSVGARLHRVEGLRREDGANAAGGDPAPDRPLAAAARVGVGGVERRDPELPGPVHDRRRLLVALAPADQVVIGADAAEPAAAEDQARDGDPGATEQPRLHAQFPGERM